MRARVLEHMGAVVDFRLYTEICLGLTGWTNGYDVALKNYVKNMVDPWADPQCQNRTRLSDAQWPWGIRRSIW
jgi:hypothetical protein